MGRSNLGSILLTCTLEMLKVSARLDLKIWADLLILPVTKCREASILQSILKVSQQIWRFPTKQYTFGNRSHFAIRSMAHEPRKPRLNDRRCSWASCLCKRRYHRTSHLIAQRKKKGIKRISGKLGQREQRAAWAKKLSQWRHNAQSQRLPVTLAWLHDLILPVLD